jgi:cysteine-rich repeat protein
VVVGTLVACNESPSNPSPSPTPAPGEEVGALLVSTALDGVAADRVLYIISAPDLAAPITGTLVIQDGVASGQLQVASGAGRDVALTFLAADATVCEGRARGLTIEPGLVAQVAVVPHCGKAAPGRNNRDPEIDAVFASRRTVNLGELVQLEVLASDPDNDALTYAWTEQATGFGFTAPTASKTSWKAGPITVDKNRLKIQVSDGRRGRASHQIEIDMQRVAQGPGTCAEPTTIRIGDRVRGFTGGKASQQQSALCTDAVGAFVSPEHVFRLNLRQRKTVTISAAGSAFSPLLYVRKDTCASADAEVVCDDQFRDAVELVDAEPGTYYIVVDGRFSGLGEFALTVTEGRLAEQCQNGVDDDGDGQLDCADTDCVGQPGCLTCIFECDPSPDDCFAGSCNSFDGRCSNFPLEATPCNTDGNPDTAEVCQSGQCVPSTAICGNAQQEPGEECDDGNPTAGDGCESCRIVAVCGNGIFEGAEECDDGNTTAGDGCGSDCRVERCGQNICDDGNVCTVNACTDPDAGTCSSTPVANGTGCDRDGLTDTLDTCQAGQCVAPTPDKAVLILDPAVLADPAFTLEAMHDRLAPDGNGGALFEQWASTLTEPMTVNGRTAAARPGFTDFLNGMVRDGSGAIDLAEAGFLPSALVNRFDLREPGTCGENRLVFTKTSGVTNGSDRMTIIFEFGVPDDGSNCQNALARWTALRDLEGDALRQASVALLLDFARPHLLNQMRSNEFINTGTWELREFHLVDGALQPFPVVDSVPFDLGQDPTFRSFVLQNVLRLNGGGRELPLFPVQFLDASSLASGNRVNINQLVPSMPGLEANLNIRSCAGCHLTETGTQFVHVIERTAEAPSSLSLFMTSEVAFRSADLDAFLSSSGPVD